MVQIGQVKAVVFGSISLIYTSSSSHEVNTRSSVNGSLTYGHKWYGFKLKMVPFSHRETESLYSLVNSRKKPISIFRQISSNKIELGDLTMGSLVRFCHSEKCRASIVNSYESGYRWNCRRRVDSFLCTPCNGRARRRSRAPSWRWDPLSASNAVSDSCSQLVAKRGELLL